MSESKVSQKQLESSSASNQNRELQTQAIAVTQNQNEQVQIELQFKPEQMSDMNRFDVHEIYENRQIAEQNKYRSDFIFLLPIIKRGKRHLIAIQKSQLICTLVKIVALAIICYYLHSWTSSLENLLPFLKDSFLLLYQIIPFFLLAVMIIDPGYVLDHEISQAEYQSTSDKKRPKDGKFCEYCKLFTKRKTNHCFQCHHCVSNFDHHCGIMGRCVGRTNVVLFYLFVIIANTLYLGLIILGVYELISSKVQ